MSDKASVRAKRQPSVQITDRALKLIFLLNDKDARSTGNYESREQLAKHLKIAPRALRSFCDPNEYSNNNFWSHANNELAELLHFKHDWPVWVRGEVADFKTAWLAHVENINLGFPELSRSSPA